jgi:hypothetical protein
LSTRKLYHLGFRGTIARNTLANVNAVRDSQIYADFAQHLIGIARRLYADDPLALEPDDTAYAPPPDRLREPEPPTAKPGLG